MDGDLMILLGIGLLVAWFASCFTCESVRLRFSFQIDLFDKKILQHRSSLAKSYVSKCDPPQKQRLQNPFVS